MIPEGWTATTIGQHADVLTGFAFKSVDYTSNEHDVKLLRGDNVAPHRLRWRDVKRFPKDRSAEVSRYQLRAGDFVVAMDRTWLPSGVKIAEVAEADLPCLLVQRVARLRAKGTLHQGLMKQFFSGHQFDQHVQAVQTETAVPHISPADLRDYPIKLPPLPEQRRIAEILSTWDRAIGTVEALIANARAQKKALMQSLLTGKRRLPGFSGRASVVSLSDVARIETGSSNREDSLDIGDFTFFDRSTDVRRSDRYLFDAEAIIIGGEGQEFTPKYFVGKFDLHQRAYALHSFKNACGRYIFYAAHHNRHLLLRYAVGSTVASLRMPTFQKVKIWLPSVEEQIAIAEHLTLADNGLDRLSTQLTALRQEKSALMQQLLTGKRRVKVDEREAA